MDQHTQLSGAAETVSARLAAILARQRAAFMAAPRPTADQRRAALAKLEGMVKRNQVAIVDAISADFGNRSRVETVMSEVLGTLGASAHARKHLGGWMRPQYRAVSMNYKPATNRVEYTPVGVVGVVSPWNYPIFLTLGPLVDILAAGNRCMIKPSELTPVTGKLLAKMIADVFAPDEVTVIEGDVSVGRAFTALPFDHLVFTGSTDVGRHVMRAAAENLVPVTLELGGKSPVIIAEDADIGKAAASIAVGKFFNAGQTCIAPDYALVPRDHAAAFGKAVISAAESMFPTINGNPDYTAIISDRHHTRLTELVSEAEAAGATVLRHRDTPSGNIRHVAPAVVIDPPLDGRLMQEEIFGPILPVISTGGTDHAIDFVNAKPRPLALYAYTKVAATERKILDQTISGGVTINGTLLHCGQDDMPFGGVGPSGIGAYHGREGFLEFSHARAIHKPGFFSGFEFLKPPHGKRTRMALKALAGFDLK
jgi:coniferyl-aldehyde dehydrogenase